MTRLLLIRHGQTRLDGGVRFWGQTDIGLSETGLKQADRLGARLRKERFAEICTSTLSRALITAETIAAGHKAKVVPCAELRECNFGYVEGLTFDEISQRFPDLAGELAAWKAVAFPGGETLTQLNQRVLTFLDGLKSGIMKATVAIVAHAGPLRLIICNLLGLGLEHWYQLEIAPASLSIVQVHPQGAVLEVLNDTSHLKD